MKKFLIYIVISLTVISVHSQEYKLFGASANGKVQLKWMSKKISQQTAFDIYRQEGGNWQKLNTTPIVPSPVISENELNTSKNPYPKDDSYKAYVEYYTKKEATANKQAYAEYTLAINSIFNNDLAKHRGIFFEDTSAQTGKIYSYKLVETNTQKELSILSNLKAGELGKAQENIKFKQNKQNIDFSWNVNEEYIGYNVYRNGSKVNDEPIMPNAENGKFATLNYKEINVPAGNYVYTVKGITFLNTESNPSAEIKIEVVDATPPAIVKGFKGERKGNTITLTWAISTDKDVAGYNIHRSVDGGKTFEKITTQPLAVTENKYSEKTKTDSVTTYQFKIEAVDKSGNGNMSMPVSVFVPDHDAPAKPADFLGRPEVGKITLSWKSNSEKDLAGYRIYRGLKDDDENEMLLLNVTPQTETTFVDTFNEKAGTKFIYKVAAVDKSFNESEKATAWIQLPDVIPPSAPFLKEANYERNQVNLKWDAVLTDAILGYDVYRIADGNELKVNSELIKESQFSDKTLRQKGVYEYYVKAIDSAKLVSKPSNKIAITTNNSENKQIQLIISQDSSARKVQLKIEGIEPDMIQEAKLFRKAGSSGFLRIPFKVSNELFTDETSEEGVIYEYYVEVITTDDGKIRSEKVSINNTF